MRKHTKEKGQCRVEAALFNLPLRLFAHTCRAEGRSGRRSGRVRAFSREPKPCAIDRPRAARDARPEVRSSGARAREEGTRAHSRGVDSGGFSGRGTHHTRDLRPAAVCCTRAACTEAPDIILRAPKETAEVDAAGATAARAVTRVRRMATGAFATMGAEMVIAAIVNVRICGTKSGRQIDGSAAFRPRTQSARRQTSVSKTSGSGASSETSRLFGFVWRVSLGCVKTSKKLRFVGNSRRDLEPSVYTFLRQTVKEGVKADFPARGLLPNVGFCENARAEPSIRLKRSRVKKSLRRGDRRAFAFDY